MTVREPPRIKRNELWTAVRAELGNKLICWTCGATLDSYPTTCTGYVEERCAGMVTVERVRAKVLERLRRERMPA